LRGTCAASLIRAAQRDRRGVLCSMHSCVWKNGTAFIDVVPPDRWTTRRSGS
jgi:hypothetical protein